MIDLTAFSAALACPDGPETALVALADLALAHVGARLFTVTTIDADSGSARRVYTNMPDVYPVAGTKTVNGSDWARQVLDEKRPFVANDIEGVGAAFFDHELIAAQGCESVLNLPVVVGGQVIGTLNLLHGPGYYTSERVAAAADLALPGAACLLYLGAYRA